MLEVALASKIVYYAANALILFFTCSPHETPFEDGTFKLTMEFSEEYPNKPPVVRFVSKMFHPNGKYKLCNALISVFVGVSKHCELRCYAEHIQCVS